MATGIFYEVLNSSESLFARARTKSEWYEAMNEAGVAAARTLDAEDSLPAREHALSVTAAAGGVGRLFVGEFRSEDDETGDPHVVFHRSSSVRTMADDLASQGSTYFRQLLIDHEHEPDIWLFEAMLRFLEQAASDGCAVIVLWGH